MTASLIPSSAVPLSIEEEPDVIRRATSGDDSATEALLRAYAPLLLSCVRKFEAAFDTREDAEATAVEGFLRGVREHDVERSPRLGANLRSHVERALADASRIGAYTVPARTRGRAASILREAQGDTRAAADLAPSRGMARETFLAVAESLSFGSLDAATEASGADLAVSSVLGAGDPSFARVEDYLVSDAALAVLTAEEREIVGLAYGFGGSDPLSDAEIATRTGSTKPTVQRKRTRALARMREALGA